MTSRALYGLGGTAVAAGVSALYALRGYHAWMPLALALAVVAVAMAMPGSPLPERDRYIRRPDALAVFLLLIIALPLYTLGVYTTPWQVNTDELTLISISRTMLAGNPGDLFGITNYFGCPAAAFFFFGLLGQALGGIDLESMRLGHALLGVACVLLAYALFRRFARPIVAFTAALIFGVNHSLVGYSRMAMWPNSSLLLELAALLLLAIGIQRRSLRYLFISGVACGLTFYFYFPGRVTVIICVAVLLVAWLVERSRQRFRFVVASAAVLVLGCVLIVPPVLIATAKNPALGFQYQREQLLIYPEGRKSAEYWTKTDNPRDAWIANIKNGVTTFNSRVVDHGWLYPNPGHGFVDPVTGVLLWIGFAVGLVRIVRRIRGRRTPSDTPVAELTGEVVAIVGFVALFVLLAVVVTKAPNYQRLLSALPFVAFLAATGLWSPLEWTGARFAQSRISRNMRGLIPAIALAVSLVVAVLNVNAFRDFTELGRVNGHEVGSTGRFVEARSSEAGHTWILAADKENLYYFWGEPWWWQGWLGFFAGPGQKVKVVPPAQLDTLTMPRRATVFISRSVWMNHDAQFRAAHKVASVTNVLPSGRLIAVEVAGGQ